MGTDSKSGTFEPIRQRSNRGQNQLTDWWMGENREFRLGMDIRREESLSPGFGTKLLSLKSSFDMSWLCDLR